MLCSAANSPSCFVGCAGQWTKALEASLGKGQKVPLILASTEQAAAFRGWAAFDSASLAVGQCPLRQGLQARTVKGGPTSGLVEEPNKRMALP